MAVTTDRGYNRPIKEALMSRLLINAAEEQKVQGLVATVKGAEKQPKEKVDSAVNELVRLAELVLVKKPIVLEEDPSPTQAGEVAGIARSSIMHLLETGRLRGYQVGTHWRIVKESLFQYLEEREKFGAAMADLDENGFGLD